MSADDICANATIAAGAELLYRILHFCPQRTSETFTANIQRPDGQNFKVTFTIKPGKKS